jgi:8-oxo-dGTP diphosphatase
VRAYPDRPVVGVGAVIFDGDRVVLVKRGHPPLQGQWNLPGGVVELGETLEEAVVREVMEETGLDVEVGPVVEVLDRMERSADGRIEYHYVIIDYCCRPRSDRLERGSDADDARWVSVGDLPRYQLTEKATAVIRKTIELLRHSSR